MPYQIIHTFEGFLAEPQLDGMTILLGRNGEPAPQGELEQRLEKRLLSLKDCGIDGLVVNVGGERYLDDEEGWKLLRQSLKMAIKMGFRFWLYDEKGYPSGGAGGLVLANHPDYEALGIKDRSGSCVKGALYEGTHAERNYAQRRRYINVLEPEAVRAFIELTHYCYAEKLGPEIMEHVEAFFTDEPSLMSAVLGELNSYLEEGIPVLDRPAPDAELWPSIPFSEELEEELSRTFNYKLSEIVPSLFSFNNNPLAVKCAFWESVSLVYEDAFAKQLSAACLNFDKKLTGHVLFEESPFANVVFQGNPFRILKHFQLPGVDLLSNKLENVSIYGHKLPQSCAVLYNDGQVMTETSDFAEHRFGERRQATPREMASALCYQFLLGVREFSYYYDFRVKDPVGYKWVNDLLRRMCSYAKDWRFEPKAALYCPYETIWSGYLPSKAPFPEPLEEQPTFVQRAENSTLELTQELFARNIQFILCDGSSLSELENCGIKKVVLPEAPVVAAKLVEQATSGKVELYGYEPSLAYTCGQLAAVPALNVKSLSDLNRECTVFLPDQALRYAAFEGDRYYCFNPSQEEKAMLLKQEAEVYDPILDQQEKVAPGFKLTIKPGEGLFLSLI